jgi:hypothetical protein
MKHLALCLALAGCALSPPPVAPQPAPPAELAFCPGPVPGPTPPRGIKTPEAIALYATRLDETLVRLEAARAECARRLDRLHQWLRANPGQEGSP